MDFPTRLCEIQAPEGLGISYPAHSSVVLKTNVKVTSQAPPEGGWAQTPQLSDHSPKLLDFSPFLLMWKGLPGFSNSSLARGRRETHSP